MPTVTTSFLPRSRRLGAEAAVYPWIWRQLPGPWPVKTLLAVVMFAAVVAVLMFWVFPWAEQALPFLNVTVE